MCAVRRLFLVVMGMLPALFGCDRGAGLRSPDPEKRVEALRAAARGADGTAALLVGQRDPDPRVRRAAAEAFGSREGPAVVDALAASLRDPDPEVVVIAAKALAAHPSMPRTRDALVGAYGSASPAGRAAIADALQSVGTSLREAVELEARALWERNLAALGSQGPARAGAAEEIGASARAEAVTRLLPLVDPNRNPDHELLAAAARGLGEAGDFSARKSLEALLEDGDARLAEAAAEALGRLGDPAAADALAVAASQGPGRIAFAAVDALALLPQAPEVGASLCEVTLRSIDPSVAARAARATREREAECPIRPLLARLGKPGTVAALSALAVLRTPDAEVASRLLPLLDPAKEPDPAIRIAALRAAGILRAPAVANAVRERALALKSRVTAARVRWIRGRLPETPLSGIDATGERRLDAVLARATGPAPGADGSEPELAPFLRPPEAEPKELGAALSALGRLRPAGAERILEELANDPSPAVRAGAIEGLGALGGSGALAKARAALSDADEAVWRAAAGALERLGPKAATALLAALSEKDVEAGRCETLARALGETGLAEAVPVLARQLGGGCGPAAAQALGHLGSPAGAAPLAEALTSPTASGRLEMVEALAQLGGTTGAAALSRELTSDRPQVRAAAARGLASLRYEPASNLLEALRSDYYGRVRRAAVDALAKLPAGASPTRP